MWPFQIGFLGSLAAGIGALLCLDRGDRRGDIGASALLAVALASSSLGIPICAAVAARDPRAAGPRARAGGSSPRPPCSTASGTSRYGGGGKESIDNLLATPAYVADAAAAATGSVFGLSIEWGRPLVLAVGALLVLAIRRGAHDPWRLAALIALPLIFWGLTGLARADLHEPGAPRYLYPGAIFLLLIALEAARGVRITRAATLALLAVIVLRDGLQPRRAAQRRRLPARPGRRARRRARRDAARRAARVPPEFRPQPTCWRRRSPPARISPRSRTSARPAPGPDAAAAAVRPRPRRRRRHAARAPTGSRSRPPPGKPTGQAPPAENAAAAETTHARRLPARAAAVGERGGRRRRPAGRARSIAGNGGRSSSAASATCSPRPRWAPSRRERRRPSRSPPTARPRRGTPGSRWRARRGSAGCRRPRRGGANVNGGRHECRLDHPIRWLT